MVSLMGFSILFAAFGMISLIGTAFVSFIVAIDKSVDKIEIESYANRILPRGSINRHGASKLFSICYKILENTNASFRPVT